MITLHDGSEVPDGTPIRSENGKKFLLTDQEITNDDAKKDAAAAEVADYVATRKYKDDRRAAYGPVEDQLDMIYWDQVNATTAWRDHIAAVKAAHPKPA